LVIQVALHLVLLVLLVAAVVLVPLGAITHQQLAELVAQDWIFLLGSVNRLEQLIVVAAAEAVLNLLMAALEELVVVVLEMSATQAEHLEQQIQVVAVEVAGLHTHLVLVVQESSMFDSRYKEKQCHNISHNSTRTMS
jgi:hypothetical protein